MLNQKILDILFLILFLFLGGCDQKYELKKDVLEEIGKKDLESIAMNYRFKTIDGIQNRSFEVKNPEGFDLALFFQENCEYKKGRWNPEKQIVIKFSGNTKVTLSPIFEEEFLLNLSSDDKELLCTLYTPNSNFFEWLNELCFVDLRNDYPDAEKRSFSLRFNQSLTNRPSYGKAEGKGKGVCP